MAGEMDVTYIEDNDDDEFINHLKNHADDSTYTSKRREKNVKKNSTAFSSDKVFRFYWWDAYEDTENKNQEGVIFLFGKTYCKQTNEYVSCCVVVRDVHRNVYFLARPFVMDDNNQPTKEAVTFDHIHREVKSNVLQPLNVSKFKSKFVSKYYAFSSEIPMEAEYLNVKYPATDPKISTRQTAFLKNPKTYSAILGKDTSFLETFLLDRKIKGPCWLDVANYVLVCDHVTWCKTEVDCSISDISTTVFKREIPPPPFTVLALNFRSFKDEIFMISCLTQSKYSVEEQAPNPPFDRHFCALTPLSKKPLPPDFLNSLSDYNATKVHKLDSEPALLNFFIEEFIKIDPDLIVGYDLKSYQNLLAERLLRRNAKSLVKLSKLSSDIRKSPKNLFLGRLVCDTKLSAKELVKTPLLNLQALRKTVLKIPDKQETNKLDLTDTLNIFKTSQDVLKLISLTMLDNSYSIEIMYQLNVVPLALELTKMAGNVMSRTLLGGTSERTEFLLLHAFSEKNYIVPDKNNTSRSNKRKLDCVEANYDGKKVTYTGGLVLEPKAGFYDENLILYMDFKSLYPSIIQEYDICFRGSSTDIPSVLPVEMAKLVEHRRKIQQILIDNHLPLSDYSKNNYLIKETALKLLANSLYGCLGYPQSRFYARHLAASITSKGREILINTQNFLQKECLFEVIYGDTDSLMINTKSGLDYDEAMQTASRIKTKVNRLYSCVEIEVKQILKKLLLLQKKRYACVSLTKTETGKLKSQSEYKGIDIVRRDCCQLAREAGKYVLNCILADCPRNVIVHDILNYLRKLKTDVRSSRIVSFEKFVIRKVLAKDPKDYSHVVQTLPHVVAALRHNEKCTGSFELLRSGDTVPYVICVDGTENAHLKRAYHIKELKNNPGNLKIDFEYYLNKELCPLIVRVCKPIEEINDEDIVSCLSFTATTVKKDNKNKNVKDNIVGVNLRTTKSKKKKAFEKADKYKFICLSCEWVNVVNVGVDLQTENCFLEKCSNPECEAKPIDNLPFLQSNLELLIRDYIKKYYRNELICQNPICQYVTKNLSSKFSKKDPLCPVCERWKMIPSHTDQKLYEQLCSFQSTFDLARFENASEVDPKIILGCKKLQEIVDKYLNHSEYDIVNIEKIFKKFSIHKNVKSIYQVLD